MKNLVSPDIQCIIDELKRERSFIIVSHENPDGDSLGAQFALALGLVALGKEVQVWCKNPVPKIYDFLPGQNWSIISREVPVDNEKVLITLDCGELERTGLIFIPGIPPLVINIDHHITNTRFAHLNWVDHSASATSELIFTLLSLLDVKLAAPIATNIYTGILTDTGSFQYSNTSAQSLQIASQMVIAGADPHAISGAVYDRKTTPALKLMGMVLNEMEIYQQQSLAIMIVTKDMLKKLNATYEDTEELVSLPQKIASMEVSILIKELNRGEYKISIRTKNRVDAAQLAGKMGGGGHPNAAGMKIKGDLNEVKEKVLKLTQEFLG